MSSRPAHQSAVVERHAARKPAASRPLPGTRVPGIRPGRGRWSPRRYSGWAYLFISPFYVLYAAFLLGPMVFAVWLSLHQWAGAGPMQWVGSANYTRLWRDQQFHTVVINTFWYVAAAVLVVVPLALLIASALNMRGIRGRDFFRLAFFLPVVLSPVMIAIVFTIILDKNYGLLNAGLHGLFGMPPINFLGDPVWAKISVILLVMWRWTGYLVIYFLAGLRNIPAELYEAAELDGARTLGRFRHITIPMLRPVTAFVVITVMIAVAQIFDEPYILTQGGPANASESLAQFIYNQAFSQQQFGYAAAAGIVLFVVVFVVSQVLARLFGVGREVGQ